MKTKRFFVKSPMIAALILLIAVFLAFSAAQVFHCHHDLLFHEGCVHCGILLFAVIVAVLTVYLPVIVDGRIVILRIVPLQDNWSRFTEVHPYPDQGFHPLLFRRPPPML